MSDDRDKPESGAGEEKRPKIKAEDNPWYLLATLYGVPEQENQALRDRNRIAWNRYFAARIREINKGAVARLIEEKPHLDCELKPFKQDEVLEIDKDFAERRKASAQDVQLPNSAWTVFFTDVQFDVPIDFEGFIIPHCSFEGAVFAGGFPARFCNTAFLGSIKFKNTIFCSQTDFNSASFLGRDSPARETDFSGATFQREAFFEGATFASKVYFESTTFSDETKFKAASFSHLADFADAIFSSQAEFDGAKFSWVKFDGKARFEKDVYFDGVSFTGETNFKNATFEAVSSFVNTKMKYTTSFEDATFKTKPPQFFNAKLHQGTVWRGITWPPTPKKKDEAERFIDAYACLKLEMDRLKKHEDELDFFALELQSRRVELGTWKGLPFAIYGSLSDYGRSYLRPLVALFMVAAIGAGAFWYFDVRTFWEALGLSVANTLNVFGFRRDFDLAIDTPLAWLKVFAAFQTILGAILLFLFGLGIRDKFRMK